MAGHRRGPVARVWTVHRVASARRAPLARGPLRWSRPRRGRARCWPRGSCRARVAPRARRWRAPRSPARAPPSPSDPVAGCGGPSAGRRCGRPLRPAPCPARAPRSPGCGRGSGAGAGRPRAATPTAPARTRRSGRTGAGGAAGRAGRYRWRARRPCGRGPRAPRDGRPRRCRTHRRRRPSNPGRRARRPGRRRRGLRTTYSRGHRPAPRNAGTPPAAARARAARGSAAGQCRGRPRWRRVG